MSFKCGSIALFGKPNAGKSTLLNQILGSKIAITSSKPQTTRDRIAGIHNEDGLQMILVDTPGYHEAWTELNKVMVDKTLFAVRDSDAILWIVDVADGARRHERDPSAPVLDAFDAHMAELASKQDKPVVIVANKVDVVPKPLILPVLRALAEKVPNAAIVPLSALTGDNLDALLGELRQVLPEHPPLYPQDEWAQVSERFLVAEIIREKLFHLTEQEIPYASFVEIERFDESGREGPRPLVKIYSRIVVERDSQKGIVIGKGGEMLKRIGKLARQDIQELLGCKVYLELYVAVEKNWTKSAKGLRKVGFERQ
ncbi:MAG: GTPase Era [Deltaproteobacteria bacterium]|nr:MAG: GTPase Era [Deltaproteobacteria bacterium]